MAHDMIVIGAGSAGAVVAARVSEDPGCRVLLIEAGPHYAAEAEMPRDLLDGHRNSMKAHDWGLSYVPSGSRADVVYPRGRVTGGSSAVNTCIALRGLPHDYDEWAERGCPEWSYEKCLPAFLRLETDHDFDGPLHGKSGPIPIRRARPDELAPIQRAFLDACEELGFPACPDHNDPTTTGYGPHAMNRIDGKRVSTALAYLSPASGRHNLEIAPNALVRRVLVRDGRASGVEIEQAGAVRVVEAPRVVLSAGAIHTPAILVRSGIGPRHTLARLGIKVVADVPAVGTRLLDHPGILIALFPHEGMASFKDPLIQTTLRYTSAGSSRANDMQLQPLSFLRIADAPLMVAISTFVGKPRAHGRLVFESADPRVPPRIETNLLGDSEDTAKLAEGVELAVRAAKTRAIAAIGPIVWPDAQTLGSRAAMEEWLRTSCGSGYHPSGTVPMGAAGDASAALDQYGRVRGVPGLYVADASIMPTITSANTNLTTIMIGERFGEWLREGRI